MEIQNSQRLILDEFVSVSSMSHINAKTDQRLRRVALDLGHAIREIAATPSTPFSGNRNGHNPMMGIPEGQLD